MQISENKSHITTTRGERGSSHLTSEHLHPNPAQIGNEALSLWGRGRTVLSHSLQPTQRHLGSEEPALEKPTLSTEYEERVFLTRSFADA